MISRIQTRQTFQRLQRDGTYVRSGFLWCSMIIDQTMAKPAIAYALGRRVGGAVERNLLRRRLREIFKTKPVLPGFYLVGAYSGAKKLTFIELGENVESLLEKCAQKPIKMKKSVENSQKTVEISKKIEKSSEIRSCE